MEKHNTSAKEMVVNLQVESYQFSKFSNVLFGLHNTLHKGISEISSTDYRDWEICKFDLLRMCNFWTTNGVSNG